MRHPDRPRDQTATAIAVPLKRSCLGDLSEAEGARRLRTWLAHALLSGKQEGDHTDSRSWTNSRLNLRNAGSPTGRVRPMALRLNDMRTSLRRLRNRKRSMSWPSVSPPRGASSESEELNRPPNMPAREPARTVAGAQPPLRSIDPPCPLSSSRRAFFCSLKIGELLRKRATSDP